MISTTFNKYRDRIEASPIAKRLVKGAFWSALGAVISRGLGLISSIIVARIIGRVGFGELGIIQSTIGMFGIFAGFGLGMTATKYVAEFRKTDPEKAGRIIALSNIFSIFSGLAMAVFLMVVGPFLAAHTLRAPHLSNLLKIGGGILLFSALNGAQTGALAGLEAFRTIAKINLYTGLLTFPVMIVGAYTVGLTGIVWALVISVLINCLLNTFALKSEARRANVPISYSRYKQEIKILMNFSFPAVLAASVVGPVNWVCNTILVNKPNGYDEMGVFNAANQWRMAILLIPALIGTIILPILSNLYGENNPILYWRVLKLNLLFNGIITLLICLPIIAFSSLIMKSYGPGFVGGRLPLILLAITSVIMAVCSIIGQSIASIGKMWFGLILNFIWATILIGLTVLFSGSGAFGLAKANLLAYVIHLITVSLYMYIAGRKLAFFGKPKHLSVGQFHPI